MFSKLFIWIQESDVEQNLYSVWVLKNNPFIFWSKVADLIEDEMVTGLDQAVAISKQFQAKYNIDDKNVFTEIEEING